MEKTERLNAIRANLQVIYSSLQKGSQDVMEAMTAIDEGNQNGAVGAILDLPDRLDGAKTFCDAIMRIHRNPR
jgi:hypothetical protein